MGVALAGVALAGCGSSATPASQEPTSLVPAKSVLYVEFAVRPQGSLHDSAESALTRIVGHSPDADLQRLVSKLFKHSHLSYGNDIQPWLGQYVGIVATEFSQSGLALIAPTNDPSAAVSTLKRGAKIHLTGARYRGISYEQGAAGSVQIGLGAVGDNAVIGGVDAFRAIVDAYRGGSIASSPGFRSVFAGLPASSLVRGYINGSGIGAALQGLIGSLPNTSGLSPGLSQQMLSGVANRLHGAYGFSLAVSPRSFSIDLRSATPHPSHAGDVASLPGQSWLALATGTGAGKPGNQGLITGQLSQNPVVARGLALIRQRIGIDVIHDVLPALGPLELSVGGTSPLSLGGGLSLTSPSAGAATRLLADIYRLAARSHSLSVQGSLQNFTITKPGLPIPRIAVAQVGPRVIATVDESFNQFLKPSSTLASNPAFRRAQASLLPDSHVPLFLDFGAIGGLVKNVPSTSAGTGGKALTILRRLDYLVLGDAPDGSDVRLVLGLR